MTPRKRQAHGLFLALLICSSELIPILAQAENGTSYGEQNDRREGNSSFSSERNLFSQPSEVVRSLADLGGSDTGAQIRRMAEVPSGPDWVFPSETTLKIGASMAAATTQLTVYATTERVEYQQIIIDAAGHQFAANHGSGSAKAKIKLVKPNVDRTKCASTQYDVPVGIARAQDGSAGAQAAKPGVMGKAGALELFTAGRQLKNEGAQIVFMHGGLYKLCYTPDGTFEQGGNDDHNNIVRTNINVLGVSSQCTTDGCLSDERWECWFAYKGEAAAENDCKFSFDSDGSGRAGWDVTFKERSKMTWSGVWPADQLTGTGQLVQSFAKKCATSEPDTTNLGTDQSKFQMMTPQVPAIMPEVLATRSTAFTLTACYCPNVNGCAAAGDYVQQFGIIYYWIVAICDYSNYLSCTTPYMRVVPQQKFVLKILCPPGGGCKATTTNRIKFIDPQPINKPTWDSSHGCKTVSQETDSAVWETKNQPGGDRVDYKVWRDKQVSLNLSVDEKLEVCFCNSGCTDPLGTNWFKVGIVKTVTAFAFASKTSSSSSILTVQYVNKPGSVTFYGGITTASGDATLNPYDSNKYSGKALINVISYDREQQYGQGSQKKTLEEERGFDKQQLSNMQYLLDLECQKENYLATLVQGPSCKSCAKQFIARVNPDAQQVNQYLSFSGETADQTMKIKKAGVVAVCYCARVSALSECLNPSYWIFAGRMTIRGPQGGQEWVFPTNIIVKMEVFGWGLDENDKLRIIPSSASCSDAGGSQTNNPTGFIKFKVGCPGTDCRKALTDEKIQLKALTSTSTGIFITAINTQPTYSTLTFSDAITSKLKPKDIITIDINSIQVSSTLLAAMTAAQKYDAFRFSGEYQYGDDSSKGYMIGHRLDNEACSGVSGAGGAGGCTSNSGVEPTKMRIPVGWPKDPGLSLKNEQGKWTRRNKVETLEEMKGIEQQAQLKACWGVNDGGNVKFYAQAGVVTFENPPAMKKAKVNLSSKQNGQTAPVVISFTTGPERASYSAAGGKMLLVLRFIDVHDKLVPKITGDLKPDGGGPKTLEADSAKGADQRKQYICGTLFVELWSNDAEGFPVPDGCYYGKRYKDAPDAQTPLPKFWREFFISFDTKNGLKHKCHKGGMEVNCEYQIVMNAQASNIAVDDPLVDIYAMCENDTGCSKPYMVFEKGVGTASMSTVAVSTQADPGWGPQGFKIERGDDAGVLNLFKMNILQVRLRGGNDPRSIKAGALMRVFLWPLTQWDIGSADCTAECVAYSENAKCSGQVGCSPKEVVVGSNRKNIIRLRLPVDMESEIDGTVMHTIKVTGLTLPTAGFFPTRIGVELTKADDTCPDFTTSTGYIYKVPASGQTTGRIVYMDRTGYGPLPFMSDTGNTLFLRLSFGATLLHLGFLDATVSISLPPQYSCAVEGDGAADPTMSIFAVDDDVDGYPDNNRGTLKVNSEDGEWSGVNMCQYKLKQYNVIYAGQVVFVKVTVSNPSVAMQKTAALNKWKVRLKGAGYLETGQPYDMGEESFISLAEEEALNAKGKYWQGNVAVLNHLADDNLQPSVDFTRSCCGATFDQRMTQQYLHVFFKTSQAGGREGFVILDAPETFNFQQSCNCQDLAAHYYAFTGDDKPRTMKLKDMGACIGSRYPSAGATYNRARVKVNGKIEENTYYGFKISITHPTAYHVSQHEGWRLWTQDKNGYGLDGSKTTVAFNRGMAVSDQIFHYHKSYGMSDAAASQVQVQVLNTQPFTVTQATAGVIVYPIEVAEDVDTPLRITAPYGYEWDDNDATFEVQTNATNANFPQLPPKPTVKNQLAWNSIKLNKGKRYGFKAQIKVPDKSPTASTNAFFVEFGYKEDEITKRFMASVIPAPPVKSLINCAVSYMTNKKGYPQNFVEFHIQTVTELFEGSGIVIKGDSNTDGFSFVCPPQPIEGQPASSNLPSMDCKPDPDTDGLPMVMLKVASFRVPAGFYKFEMEAVNPTSKKSVPGKWTFGTYKRISEYPGMKVAVDMALTATGFVINDPMNEATLLELDEEQRSKTYRDDRPGKPNQLIFGFKLAAKPQNEGQLKLRGPRGFEFHEDCLPGVETSANMVFGENTEKDWPNDLKRWEDQHKPSACVGDGPYATLTLPIGLERSNMYVFRIAVKANPQATPTRNRWTVDFSGESSDPFPGFPLWTFTGTSVQPVSTAKTATGANTDRTENPITLTVKPYKEIPTGGMLRVSAPAGFIFVTGSWSGGRRLANNECRVTFKETGGTSSFGTRDIRCEVDNNTKLLLHVTGDKPIAAGKEYTLIVKVYNPAGTIAASDWVLESFKKKTAEPSSALDESRLPGFAINSVLNTWTVRNKNDVFNGKTQVQDVLFTMQFPDALKDGDVLEVTGPKGFDLGGGEQTQCNEFKWPSDMNFLPSSGEPTCTCQADVCKLQFVINESKDPAFPQNEDLRFEVSTSNPAKTPEVTENFWKVQHRRGGIIKSSHVTQSWNINPQLEDVFVFLTGANKAAEATSDIIIKFIPVSNADTLMLEAIFPTEFDFSKATVSSQYEVDDQTENEVIIINKCNIVAGKTTEITISSVRLGRGGGGTTFNLTTYRDKTMKEKMDERLEFVGGFRLPGKITVSSRELKSIYASSPQAAQTFPVKSLFQARVDEHARAEFTLTFSQRVTASQRLVISCQGEGAYELQDSDFIILGTTTIETTVERNAAGALVATLMPGNPDTQTALQADTPYQVFMGVRPKDGSNTWKFETTDGPGYPTNTNDGNTPGFNPVKKMTLDVQAQRSPPRAVIEVVLNVDRGGANVKQLLIIAPPAFIFPPDDCGDMCQAGQALGSTGRKTATISSPTGEALTKLDGLRIKVQTPERDPVPLDWYVEGRGQGAGTTTGWGDGPGFKITQMLGTTVSYAGVANLQGGRMTFTFSLDRNTGAQIAVEPPQGYQLSCSSEGALAQISLPGGKPDCTDDPLTLMLNETLVSGDYAFGIAANMPPETPAPNNFNLIIRDREGNVVDAMYGIPGKNIVPLKVGAPTLSWARSEAGQPSLITVGITFEQDTDMVKALLITFPDNFIHDIQKPTDVRNLNKRFPVAASTDWADTLHTDRIKILLDDTDDVTTILADTYKFNFPVLVPCCTQADMPRNNVWYLSLCQSRSCRKPTDTTSVLVAFPMAGFNLGELSPETLRRSEGGSMKTTINGVTISVSAGAAIAANL